MSRWRPPQSLDEAHRQLAIVEARLRSGDACDLAEHHLTIRRARLRRAIEKLSKPAASGGG